MSVWWRRIILSTVVVLGIIFGYSLLYQWGMAAFEGQQKTYMQSLQVVIESLTTAGFGGDAPWQSREMNLFIIIINMTGVLLVFMALPLFIVPLFREALHPSPSEESELTDHVIICSSTASAEVLRDELETAGIPYLIVTEDSDLAVELQREGVSSMYGDPRQIETLRAARAEDARALVADADDETNASIILSARQLTPDLSIIAVVEDEEASTYLRYAGANEVVRPRHVLGQTLAKKATTSVSEELNDAVEVGTELEVTELLVQEGSELAGRTLAESGLREQMGITVIGAWVRGDFVATLSPDMPINEHTILLVAGRRDELKELKARTIATRKSKALHVVVAGYGITGRTAAEALASEGFTVCVVDIREMEGVDVVGNIADESALEAADVANAQSILLTIDNDRTAIFTTLVLKRMVPDIEIIVRANDPSNVVNLYRAGAEYVVALPTITGRMTASLLIEGEDVLTPASQFELVRTGAPGLVGQSLGDADVRAQTGCTIIAAERNGELMIDLGPDFVVRSQDKLIVAGSTQAIQRFLEWVS